MDPIQFDFKMVEVATQFLQFTTTVCFFFLGAMGGMLSYCWLREAYYKKLTLCLGVIPYGIVVFLLHFVSGTYRLIFKSLGERNLEPLTNQMLNEVNFGLFSLPFSFASTTLGLLILSLITFSLVIVMAKKK